MRFFLDYKTKLQSLYDYQGNEFPGVEAAIDFAEATAQVLRNSLIGEWSCWPIEVRDIEGKKVFSSPVGTAAPIAA